MKKLFQTVFRFLLILFSVILSVAILFVIVGSAYFIKLYSSEDVDSIVVLAGNNGEASKLYAYNEEGDLVEYAVGELSSGITNDYATLAEIPKALQNAFIAIEDKRFYSHIGFDFITTLKATWKYITSEGGSPGGSTITQQLIKNLTGDDDISIKRKVLEIIRAIKLERKMSKESILELYLNSIYLSQGIYGVKAAAKLYFNKDVRELNLLESVAVAAITQAPTKWDPVQNPDNNRKRRNVILMEMFEQGYIDETEYQNAFDQPLELNLNYEKSKINTSSWYTDAVINETVQLLSENLGVSSKVATQYLYNGGYRITVAVNTKVQEILENHYKNNTLFTQKDVQSSFVVIDPDTGNVLGLVGGIGEKKASRILNRATQSTRSPGSAIKPLSVYLPALDRDLIGYGSAFDDVPLYFGNGYSAYGWPENADKIYRGYVNLEYAVSHSLNTVSVSVLKKLGIQESYDYLESLGISTLIPSGIHNDKTLSALALGGMTNGVSLLELTSAYTSLANNGIYSEARCVLRITDKNGRLIVDNTPYRAIVAKEESVITMTKLLTSVISQKGGTAYGAITRIAELTEVAGKTGTTSNNYDRWFVGYTPYAIGGIWLGYDTPTPLSSVGAKEHLRVWDTIMSEIHGAIDHSENSFYLEDSLFEARYCAISGKIATEACLLDPRGSQTVTGYFSEEDLPQDKCDRHILIEYCTEGKGIAGSACPRDAVVWVSLVLADRHFPIEVLIADAEYCTITLPENYLPCYSLNTPYYQNYIPDSVYIGKSDVVYPFNRFCSRHIPLFGV